MCVYIRLSSKISNHGSQLWRWFQQPQEDPSGPLSRHLNGHIVHVCEHRRHGPVPRNFKCHIQNQGKIREARNDRNVPKLLNNMGRNILCV